MWHFALILTRVSQIQSNPGLMLLSFSNKSSVAQGSSFNKHLLYEMSRFCCVWLLEINPLS